MENLTQLLKRYGKNRWSSHWVGERPDVRDGEMLAAILKNIGFPQQTEFDASQMVSLERSDAAYLLAYISTQSLAYGLGRKPSQGVVKSVSEALRDLDDSALFFTNGNWMEPNSISWYSLSQSTFDAGVIGFDAKHAFVFWVQDED